MIAKFKKRMKKNQLKFVQQKNIYQKNLPHLNYKKTIKN